MLDFIACHYIIILQNAKKNSYFNQNDTIRPLHK